MKHSIAVAALMSLLTCVACADQPSKSASLAYAPQQYSAANWEEMAAADHVAPATPMRLLLR